MVSFISSSLKAKSNPSGPPLKRVKFNLSSQQSTPIPIQPKFPFPVEAKQDLKEKNVTVIVNTVTVNPIFGSKNQGQNSHERAVQPSRTVPKSEKEEDWSELSFLFILDKEKAESSEKEMYSQKSDDTLKDVDMSDTHSASQWQSSGHNFSHQKIFHSLEMTEGSDEKIMIPAARAREKLFQQLEKEDLDFSFSTPPEEMSFLLKNDQSS